LNEHCEIYCGNGWCDEGKCIPNQIGCQTDQECSEGMRCEIVCDLCDANGLCGGGCVGTCVPIDPGCQSDADCAEGVHCEFPMCDCRNPIKNCEMCYYYPGTCVPNQTECASDADCPAGFQCEMICAVRCDSGDPGCEVPPCTGTCQSIEPGCQSDADCGEGQICEQVYCADFTIPCPNQCLPGTWMFFAPMQCVLTPWEQDAQTNPENYGECMINCGSQTNCGGTGFEEVCIVKKFLALQGIVAHDVRNVQTQEVVCDACAVCARGNTIYG
jgi:Cys-rich repeat protein